MEVDGFAENQGGFVSGGRRKRPAFGVARFVVVKGLGQVPGSNRAACRAWSRAWATGSRFSAGGDLGASRRPPWRPHSQTLQNTWISGDLATKRRILEIACLNCRTERSNLVPKMRKTFDELVEGLDLSKSRGRRCFEPKGSGYQQTANKTRFSTVSGGLEWSGRSRRKPCSDCSLDRFQPVNEEWRRGESKIFNAFLVSR